MSTWKMDETTFIKFLNGITDLVEAGKLDRKFLRWAQSPTESPLAGFLTKNYTNPDVQKIIVRSRIIFQDQPECVAQYDMMLNGESREKLIEFETAMREDRLPDDHTPIQTPAANTNLNAIDSETKTKQGFGMFSFMTILLCLLSISMIIGFLFYKKNRS